MMYHIQNLDLSRGIILFAAMFFCIAGYAEAVELLQQQQQVSGQVTDSLSGEPLPGVNILVKGTTSGTSTDINGEYELTVESLQDTLEFSYVGYVTEEVPIEGRSTVNIQLQPQAIIGEDLIVVGYGTQESRDITGSVGSVRAEDLEQVVATNPVQAMQGRVPGVNISQTGYNPGQGAEVRIRGTRSITASNDPLYVIDGVPISRASVTLNEINPSEIESIEVLKDASATAIYGSRGANGVLLITTKRGETGVTNFNYSSYVGTQSPLNEPDLWGPAEYVEYVRESFRNSATSTYNSPEPNMEEDMEIPQFAQDPYTLESVLMGYDEQGNWHPDRVRGFDWVDAVTRTGVIQNHQLSVSKGIENGSLMISGGYYDNVGMVKNMDYSRYNLRVNIDYDITERIKLSGSTLISRVDENVGPNLYGAARTIMPISRPRDDDGNWIFTVGNDPLMTNPLLDIDGIKNESQKNRIMNSIALDIDLFEGVSYRGNFGYDYRTARDGIFQSRFSRARLGDPPAASYGGNNSTDLLIENMLFFETSLGEPHELEVTAMNSIQSFRFENHTISVRDLPYEQQEFYNVGSASEILSVGSGLEETKILSWMGRINYRLFDKYLFTFTGRSDGSSTLAEGNKHQFFPSGAIAWRLSDEDFMQQMDFVNDLKLRVSYGLTGNSAINPYQTQGSLNLERYVWGETVAPGFAPGSMPNQSLKWETTAQANIGLDFGILDHRISGSIDVYQANTSDLLMPRALPVASGYNSVLDNVGKTRNSGLELAISTINTGQGGDFRWNTDIVFSTNKEEIVELVEGKEDDVGNQWFIGYPVNVFYNLDAIGIWQDTPEDQAEMDRFNENGHSFEPGLVKISDQNGDYRINEADRVILGSNRPEWTGSITNNINYKNLDLSFQVYIDYGTLGSYNQGLQLNGRYNQPAVNYWTPDDPSNRYPKPNFDWLGPPHIGPTYIEDASFARLKFVTLGYTFPVDLMNRIGGKKLRVYLSAQNPYIYTNFTGPDPEGAQSVETPSPKTFMFGIDAGF